MLQRIELKNFVIIESLELDFSNGMTVLTGETGAGKSIILDAIELALGGRLSTQILPEGADQCAINLYFDITHNSEAQAWLSAHELNNDAECIISRIITREGRSRGYINGQPFPLQTLGDFGYLLISIHGQHQHQSLSKRDHQRQMLDTYAKHETLCQEVQELYNAWQQIQKQLNKLQNLEQQGTNQVELLQFQLDEFAKLNLQAGEVENLTTEHKQLTHAEQLITQCETSLINLCDDEENSVHRLLHKTLRALNEVKQIDSSIEPICNLLQDASIQLNEATLELRSYLEKIQINPERLQWLEQRLSAIHNLARKHKIATSNLLEFENNLKEELVAVSSAAQQCEILQQQAAQIEKNYQNAAAKLHESRKRAAEKLSELVVANIHQLGMEAARFNVNVSKMDTHQPSAHGLDNIEFLIATNPGQPLQLLSKIASGGELSRISLAIQIITVNKMTLSTLIFDEVDTGIGGKIAEVVGRLLRQLGSSAQIFCVTHLPQVAVQAHQHICIEKVPVNKHQVKVQAKFLTAEERVLEVARMLGGIEITKQTKAHAKEMLLKVD